jgi:pyruvate formate lyase activating enzyme
LFGTPLLPGRDEGAGNFACIFDIQRFSLHDGPGIRTTIFFKGCLLKCRWCQNPESHKRQPEILYYQEHCRQCYACRRYCSNNAILTGGKQRIDYSRCEACGACVEACEYGAVRMAGRAWEAGLLVEEVLKDQDFFIDSGGGVTLSGGEPVLQARFLEEFLPKLKDNGIHVTLETAGFVPWGDLERILPHLDLIYYDLKLIDNSVHKKFIGQGNQIILDNFVRLAASFDRLQPRMPVIPGINNDETNIKATARFLRKSSKTVLHCLPYHRLGESKLGRMNKALKPMQLPDLAPENLKTLIKTFQAEGIEVVIPD